jgi:hypothetical protein
MRRLLFIVMALVFWLPPPVYGQSRVCLSYDLMVRALRTSPNFERKIGLGIVGHSQGQWRFELWASEEGERTWTALGVNTSGVACIISAGKHWEEVGLGYRVD